MNDPFEVVQMAVGELELWPGNPRRSNGGRIRESIQENGLYRPLVVQKSTRRVIAGNHTLEEARGLGMETVGVVLLDVDDDRAQRIMLADNRTGDFGGYDDELLRAVMTGLEGDLAGTGWHEDDSEIAGWLAEARYDYIEEAPLIVTGGGVGVDADAGDGLPPLVLETVRTGAEYAETAEEEAARREKQARQVAGVARGTKEIILVYPLDEHREMYTLLEILKARYGGMKHSAIVQMLVRADAGSSPKENAILRDVEAV